MATITDVAARAGVSIKTVSRVFNHEPHVRQALRDKVMKAAAELGYQPNLAARQLAASRSFLISFIIEGVPVSYFSQMLVAAAAECRRYGYHLVSETFDQGETGQQVVARVVAQLRPDGIILVPPQSDDAAIVAEVERAGIPLVRIAGTGALFGTAVRAESRGISREMVRHLVELGHRRIGMIAPPLDHGAAQERLDGYRDVLDEAGIPFDPALVERGDFSFASGAVAMERLMRIADRPTAIFAANDGMALGALAIARRMGMGIPQDVAIAGFDDSPGSRMVFPPLTTVRQPIAAIAHAAVAAITGKGAPTLQLDHELVLRGSTTGSDELVLSALDA